MSICLRWRNFIAALGGAAVGRLRPVRSRATACGGSACSCRPPMPRRLEPRRSLHGMRRGNLVRADERAPDQGYETSNRKLSST
jgi:hypothetical protein